MTSSNNKVSVPGECEMKLYQVSLTAKGGIKMSL